ncbi:MAG TPA: SH3 domain-containing protein, partial [Tepidiformaceae bacterium]|nr:SH3 domain-containing protein [Tepidiformaceae bacterium]
SLYKAIAWVESDYANASHSTLYGGVGPILTSIDCGYGIGQITTGMGHLAAPPALDVRVPSARQAIIGTHPVFNIAEGIRILADKWNSAPQYRPIAGAGDPAYLEDWYYAVWSYNGFAFSNHPLNPAKSPLRGNVWNCGDPNAPGYGVFNRGDYTYNEVVYGCLRYPPVAKGAAYPPPLGENTAETPVAPNAPRFTVGDTAVVSGTGNGLNLRVQPGTQAAKLASLADGTVVTILGGPTEADGFTWWNIQAGDHTGWSAQDFLVKVTKPDPDAPVNPEGRLWLPQVFVMPSLSVPAIAAAMSPAKYDACDDAGFAGGCPEMDFPTSFPELGIEPHRDSTPPLTGAQSMSMIGSPQIQVVGDRTVTITASKTAATSASFSVRNAGTWISPFRVRTSASWLVVRRPGDPVDATFDGGVAIGAETAVVIQKTPRKTANGYEARLEITVNPAYLPEGALSGTVLIEPLLGGGGVTTITVKVERDNSLSPTPTATPKAPTYRSVLPGLSAEGGH